MEWIIYLFTGVHGRISRLPFWIALVVLIGFEFASTWLAGQIEGEQLTIVVGIALDYPEFCVMIKRANDRGMPLWPVASFFILDGLTGFLAMLHVNGSLPPEDPVIALLNYIQLALAVVLLIDLGFRRGTIGPNRFGPDPLAGRV